MLDFLVYLFGAVHQCLFCQQVFGSSAAKDDHILEHFSQEMCTDCNQNLIRIGSKLYAIHDAVTCVRRDTICDKAIRPSVRTDEPKKQTKSTKPSKKELEKTPKFEVSGYEEILIKVEEEDEEENQILSQDTQHENVNMEQIVEVEVEVEESDPEYIIIDFNDIPLVREKPSDQQQPIPQPNPKLITKCDVCEQEFDCVFFLESHRKLKHPTATITSSESGGVGGGSNTNIPPAPIVKTPTKGTKSIKKPKSVIKIKQTEGNKRLECLLCNKLYKTETSLRHHIDTIHDPNARKYKCEICGTGFFREAALQNHHENQHLDMKKFICAICNTGLKSKIALERHMFQHTGKRPFKCSWDGCKKTFTTTANRDEHYRSHTGEKRFQCPVEGCNNRYIFAADIRKHLYKIHNIFPKKFPCDLCTQVFPQRAMLQKHMKKHPKKR